MSLTVFVAFIYLLFTAARAAPVAPGARDACAAVRISSVTLNQVAKSVVEEYRGFKDRGEFETSLAWIEAKDMCDPSSLKNKSLPCLGKMLRVLSSYSAEVEGVSTFQSCSAFASRVKPVLHKLHEDMSTCVTSLGEWRPANVSHTIEEKSTSDWERTHRCHYIMDRLFSFSILTARVFALGDPTLHSDQTTKCM